MVTLNDDASKHDATPPAWPTDLADALDLAVAYFDADWSLAKVNARWRHRFGVVSGRLDDVIDAMFAGQCDPTGTTAAPETLREAIHLYARDAEVALPDGSIVLLTSSPLASGGVVVTTRDMQRDRLSEDEILRLLSEGLASVDMGMLLWDSGLIVRLANQAWVRNVLPVSIGNPISDIVESLMAIGLDQADHPTPGHPTVEQTIAAMHRQPRQWVLEHSDGRSTRLHTYPTQTGGVLATAYDTTRTRSVEERAQALMADAIESMGVGILMIDENLNVRLLNRALRDWYFAPNEAPPPDTPVTQVIVEALTTGNLALPEGMDVATMIDLLVNRILVSGEAVALPTKDGRQAEGIAYPTRMGGYVGVIRDVTERAEAEQAAEEAHALTRTIVENLGEGVALLDADMRILMMNPAYRRVVMNDLPVSDVGDTFEEGVRANINSGNIQVPPEDMERVVSQIVDMVRTHQKGVEQSINGGRTLEASTFGTPDGGFLIQMRDITERKEAERAAREADNLLRTTIEASPTPILVSRRKDGRIFFTSAALHALLGGIESTVDLFADASARGAFLGQLQEAGEVNEFAAKLRRSDHSLVDVLISARSIEYAEQELIISSILDMTEVLEMQSELERQREAAHQAEKMSAMGELLAGVAHELNNPLSIIVAHAMMLESETKGSPSHTRAKKIGAAAERSGRIVRSFLSMARKRPLNLELADVNDIVLTSADISTYGIRSSGTDVQVAFADNLPAIAADADQVVQVVSNLIVNAGYAVRDLGASGIVRIATSRTPTGDALIEIADNGPGVPEDIRRRVFEPFFTTKNVGSGTGIGLAFCHRIVTAHGGEVRIDDAPIGGAVFSIKFPAATDLAKRREPRRAPTGSGRVLVLDDESGVCEALVEMLRSEGFDAHGVSSARAALAACRKTSFDAVLSDVRMPDMDGTQFLEALHTENAQLAARTGFVTGDGVGAEFSVDGQVPAPPMISKPVTRDDLVAFVMQLMEAS